MDHSIRSDGNSTILGVAGRFGSEGHKISHSGLRGATSLELAVVCGVLQLTLTPGRFNPDNNLMDRYIGKYNCFLPDK